MRWILLLIAVGIATVLVPIVVMIVAVVLDTVDSLGAKKTALAVAGFSILVFLIYRLLLPAFGG